MWSTTTRVNGVPVTGPAVNVMLQPNSILGPASGKRIWIVAYIDPINKSLIWYCVPDIWSVVAIPTQYIPKSCQ
ncbi:MAG: hypothetical protein ACKOAD_00915 [Gammaproteobacteria bacterium]